MLIPIIKESEKLREVFAEIEHEQWIAWSKNIAETENITPARLERWQKLWRPYSELTEAEKDQDREWGDKGFSLNNSSQLALLEGQKKMIEGMKKPTYYGEAYIESDLLVNSALTQVIQSLEESITYLKTKI